MKGLVIKDLSVLIKQFKVFLIIMIGFSLLPGFQFSAFIICYCAIASLSTISYDEHSKWDKLAAMMPYTKKELVFSKYITGYICITAAMFIALFGKTITSLFTKQLINFQEVGQLFLIVCIGLLIQAIDLPIVFKLGVEKGRMLIAFSLIVAAALVFPLLTVFRMGFENIVINIPLVIMVLVLLVVILNIISVSLSHRFYSKREM
ncbi:MAG: ABC-2 transporter permease [Oscillospiraceae bacterium]